MKIGIRAHPRRPDRIIGSPAIRSVFHVLNPKLVTYAAITISSRGIQQHAHRTYPMESTYTITFRERGYCPKMGEEDVTFAGTECVADILKICVCMATDVVFLGNGGGADGLNYGVAVFTDLDSDAGCEVNGRVGKIFVVAAGWPVGGIVGDYDIGFTGLE